jgi:hypothetical protein
MIGCNLPSDFECHSFSSFFHTACRVLGNGLMVPIQRDNRSSLKDCVSIHIFYVSDLMVPFIFFIVFDKFSS